jgi:uncharacterized protein (DUF697 family)
MEMAEHEPAAGKIVEKHVWYAAGAGLIPVPLVDMAVITGINLNLIKALSAQYGVEFREDRGKAIVGALAGGLSAGVLAQNPVANGILRAIPLIGQTVAALSMSVFGGAFTYAVGQVFIQHYATGGTMLDFDTSKARTLMSEQFEKGKQLLRRKPAAAAEPPAGTAAAPA